MISPTVCPYCGGSLNSNDSSSPSKGESVRPGIDSPPREGSDGAADLTTGPDLTETLSKPDPIAAAALEPSDDEYRANLDDRKPLESPLGIDLGGSNPPIRASNPPDDRPTRPERSSTPANASESSQDQDDPPTPRSAWPVALLLSYASAMTLACGWLWWNGRPQAPASSPPSWLSGPDAATDPSLTDRADSGRRAGASTTVEPAESIAEDRMLSLGDTVWIDALEVVPEGVSVGAVELRRTRVDGRTERQKGGSGVLRLHLRLRNTSDDVIFAPLDESFVREPDRKLPETFIQDGSGTRVYAYPLPISSEWEISGQLFHELRPGEMIETIVLSDTESMQRLNGPMTWRLRLRTAPETTVVLGVAFDEDDIERVR